MASDQGYCLPAGARFHGFVFRFRSPEVTGLDTFRRSAVTKPVAEMLLFQHGEPWQRVVFSSNLQTTSHRASAK